MKGSADTVGTLVLAAFCVRREYWCQRIGALKYFLAILTSFGTLQRLKVWSRLCGSLHFVWACACTGLRVNERACCAGQDEDYGIQGRCGFARPPEEGYDDVVQPRESSGQKGMVHM